MTILQKKNLLEYRTKIHTWIRWIKSFWKNNSDEQAERYFTRKDYRGVSFSFR